MQDPIKLQNPSANCILSAESTLQTTDTGDTYDVDLHDCDLTRSLSRPIGLRCAMDTRRILSTAPLLDSIFLHADFLAFHLLFSRDTDFRGALSNSSAHASLCALSQSAP